jgi:general secretion pathway protein K
MLTAILLVALAAILATAIAFQTGLSARRGASSFTVEQGLEFGAAAEYLAAAALSDDFKRSGATRQDTPNDSWAQGLPPTEVASGMTIEAKLEDESGKFNLNTLIDAEGHPDADKVVLFKALLRVLHLEDKWAPLFVDWIDKDSQPQTDGGAEDNAYTLQHPGYRAANQYVTSISELQSLPGLSAEVFRSLAPHVTALPPSERKINVCFATPAVLDALLSAAPAAGNSSGSISVTQQYTLMDPKQFASSRTAGCFPDVRAMKASVTAGNAQTFMDRTVQEESQYFRLHTWVTIGTTRFALYSLLNRNQQQVTVVGRTFGTD